jgi:hypothetical protein
MNASQRADMVDRRVTSPSHAFFARRLQRFVRPPFAKWHRTYLGQ